MTAKTFPFPETSRDARIGVVLLGTGAVGSALLRQLGPASRAGVALVGVASSSVQYASSDGLGTASLRERLAAHGSPRDDAALCAALYGFDCARQVVIDATASTDVASRHAQWLRQGYDVVTANKTAVGGTLQAWRDVQAATWAGGSTYGDSATVGAGLPVLSTLRRLHGCGDRLLSLEGVFSGSLSWLFNHYDGTRPFSALLAEARAWGYTEPDPRIDLSGADVARKLLILARSAGHNLDAHEVEIENLVPTALRDVDADAFRARAHELDAPLAEKFAAAKSRGKVLRFLARLDARGRASVGVCEIEAAHPAARMTGCDNLFALTTSRYHAQPLVIQGAGAGPEVTAQALLADVLALRERGVPRRLALAV
ncbi:MAG TPA: homoserine dehydrogenase [Rhodanobacteraceae bacterium]|nr:homoserine dehydrogenase [Rhodanobacteraceae bacterium]